MLAILNSLNAHNFPIFQLILMLLVSIFMVHIALSDKTYLSLWLLSSLRQVLLYRFYCTISWSMTPYRLPHLSNNVGRFGLSSCRKVDDL